MSWTKISARAVLLAIFSAVLVCGAAWATPTEIVLYNFCQLSGCADGDGPNGGLVFDAAGNLYGTTLYGGAKAGSGTVFELSPSPSGWTESVLYNFCSLPSCADGQNPSGSLIFDALGNIYGTTEYGGEYGAGTVYELSPSASGWAETVLYSFCAFPCIANPIAGVIMDKSGNLYGPAYYDDIFELSPSGGTWTETTLYEVGDNTAAGVSFNAAGNLFGVGIWDGGSYPAGYVFELSPSEGSWQLSVPYVFNKNKAGKYTDGYYPYSTPIFDKAGDLYGTTYSGEPGATVGGTAFKLTPGRKKWGFKLLHTFTGKKGDGDLPLGPLAVDGSGNVYGTTSYGGSDVSCDGGTGCGIVYELSPSGTTYTETILWTFAWANGAHPMGGVILDKAGNLYGTTYWGGTSDGGNGTVFEVIP